MKRIVSFSFFWLYLLFLGNANLYAYTTITEAVGSCCSEEATTCCGSCSSEESSDSEGNCCQGKGCCGFQDTRIPSSIFHAEESKLEVTEKIETQVKSNSKFNKADFYTLNFFFARVAKNNSGFYWKRELISDRQSKFSIWRC